MLTCAAMHDTRYSLGPKSYRYSGEDVDRLEQRLESALPIIESMAAMFGPSLGLCGDDGEMPDDLAGQLGDILAHVASAARTSGVTIEVKLGSDVLLSIAPDA